MNLFETIVLEAAVPEIGFSRFKTKLPLKMSGIVKLNIN